MAFTNWVVREKKKKEKKITKQVLIPKSVGYPCQDSSTVRTIGIPWLNPPGLVHLNSKLANVNSNQDKNVKGLQPFTNCLAINLLLKRVGFSTY